MKTKIMWFSWPYIPLNDWNKREYLSQDSKMVFFHIVELTASHQSLRRSEDWCMLRWPEQRKNFFLRAQRRGSIFEIMFVIQRVDLFRKFLRNICKKWRCEEVFLFQVSHLPHIRSHLLNLRCELRENQSQRTMWQILGPESRLNIISFEFE